MNTKRFSFLFFTLYTNRAQTLLCGANIKRPLCQTLFSVNISQRSQGMMSSLIKSSGQTFSDFLLHQQKAMVCLKNDFYFKKFNSTRQREKSNYFYLFEVDKVCLYKLPPHSLNYRMYHKLMVVYCLLKKIVVNAILCIKYQFLVSHV